MIDRDMLLNIKTQIENLPCDENQEDLESVLETISVLNGYNKCNAAYCVFTALQEMILEYQKELSSQRYAIITIKTDKTEKELKELYPGAKIKTEYRYL